MPARVDIDLSAIVRNARALAARSGARLIPMVKADAYGTGAGPVTRALDALDPLAFGVATVREGEELRALGVARPVIVFTPLLDSELGAARSARLTPALGSAAAITAWQRLGGGSWHLSIDTGMARAGVPWREAVALREILASAPPDGVFTHFHSAELGDGSMEAQDQRFDAAVRELGLPGVMRHTDNSAGVLRRGRTDRDAVRPGIFLYGGETVSGAAVQPEAVAHLRAPIVDIRGCESGDSVSYGATFVAPCPMRVATIGAGYADGYPRNVGMHGRPGASVLLQGGRVPIVGRVTMDMIMIDVTDVKCAIGDSVTLIGRDGGELVTVAEVGASAGISPYEVLVGLNGRAERFYDGN
ncbi:MAG TPA: alanine racemase [Gemmatimonadaceae bacterium]|nr:alanine racemase [Gemmatimonadaceae bacterium]